MPPKRRNRPPDSGTIARLADYTPRGPSAAADPTMTSGYANWGQPAQPLTARQQTQVFGATGTVNYQGIFADDQYGYTDPPEWQGEERWRTIKRAKLDGTAMATRNVCLLPLLQATYSINPGSDAQEDVDVAQALADNLLHALTHGFHFFLRQFYGNRLDNGHYLGEKVWTFHDDDMMWRLRKIAVRPPETVYRWFGNDDDELDRIMQKVWVQNADGVTGSWRFPGISAEKLLLSTRNQYANDWRGESLFRPCWFHLDTKHKYYLIDGIAAERNGMGVPTLEEPPILRQQSDRDQAALALENFRVGENVFMEIPNGWKFSLQAVTGTPRDIMPMVTHHDLLISRSILAHFIQVDSGGTLIAARDASSFFLQSEQAESDEGIEALNVLARQWVDFNYENVERYPTVTVVGIENRDLDALLRGVGALFTAGALTYDANVENALRDYLDFPQLAAGPEGGGQPTVDTDSQGHDADAPVEAVERTGIGIGAVGDTQALSRPRAASRAYGAPPFQSGVQTSERLIHLTGPRTKGRPFTVRLAGSYPPAPSLDEPFELPAPQAPPTVRGPKQPSQAQRTRTVTPAKKKARVVTAIGWRLGSGGKSGEHCDQCVELAENGPYTPNELPSKPRDGDTWCGDSCTCSLVNIYGDE